MQHVTVSCDIKNYLSLRICSDLDNEMNMILQLPAVLNVKCISSWPACSVTGSAHTSLHQLPQADSHLLQFTHSTIGESIDSNGCRSWVVPTVLLLEDDNLEEPPHIWMMRHLYLSITNHICVKSSHVCKKGHRWRLSTIGVPLIYTHISFSVLADMITTTSAHSTTHSPTPPQAHRHIQHHHISVLNWKK